jgi:excisionase family DNA binding protein
MDSESPFLTIGEAAKRLHCSPRTIYKWVEEEAIPYMRVGGKMLRFERTTLDAWVRSGATRV